MNIKNIVEPFGGIKNYIKLMNGYLRTKRSIHKEQVSFYSKILIEGEKRNKDPNGC